MRVIRPIKNHLADNEERPAATMGGTIVPHLQRLRMWPCHYTKAADALRFLKTIDHLEVNTTVKCERKLYYVVQVFLKNPETRIPTSTWRPSFVTNRQRSRRPSGTRLNPPSSSQQASDYQISRPFSDFVKLRYNIWVHAQQPREERSCIYCDNMTKFVGTSSTRPSNLMEKIWAFKTHRKEVMEAYLNRIVTLAIGRGGNGQRSPQCHGFDHIPCRLEQFLKRELNPN